MENDEPTLITYTIFDHPTDYPEHWVVRSFSIRAGQQGPLPGQAWLFGSLGAARNKIARIAPGLVCLTRCPSDDPIIVETWL